VDPVQGLLLFRTSGSAENQTRDLWICRQGLGPLDHRGGHLSPCFNLKHNVYENGFYPCLQVAFSVVQSIQLIPFCETGRWIMSRNTKIALIYYRHQIIGLLYLLHLRLKKSSPCSCSVCVSYDLSKCTILYNAYEIIYFTVFISFGPYW
jgi:hypothetical protein